MKVARLTATSVHQRRDIGTASFLVLGPLVACCPHRVMSEPGFEPDVAAGLSPAERAEVRRRKQLQFAMLPVAQYPRLVECAPEMTCAEPEFHYRFGIDLFIAGVQAMAERL